MAEASLTELAEAFSAGTLPPERWTHEAHLRVGAWHVHHFGAAAALPLLRDRIRHLNERQGGQNTATSGYHETITAAYVQLIAAFLATCEPDMPLSERVNLLVRAPLADKSVLLQFWSRERLMSVQARAEWVEPDLAALELSALTKQARTG